MTCEQIHERLELVFPGSEVPAEVAAHLAECDACRSYAAELAAVARELTADSAAPALGIPAGLFIAAVNRRIDRAAPPVTRPARWRPLAAAAVVLLTAIAGFTGYRLGRQASGPLAMVAGAADQTATDSTLAELLPDSDYLELLAADLDPARYYDLEDVLLDQLTEAELEQLDRQFGTGDRL